MCFFMFGAILKATNSSFKKGITFCRSIYVKKVMKLLAFIFEQPSNVALVFLSSFFLTTCPSESFYAFLETRRLQ